METMLCILVIMLVIPFLGALSPYKDKLDNWQRTNAIDHDRLMRKLEQNKIPEEDYNLSYDELIKRMRNGDYE